LQEGISARVVSLPGGFDPDSFIRREKMAGFQRILHDALPVVEYMLEQALRRHGTQTVEAKVRTVRELIPALNRLQDPLEQSLYVERVASRLGLKESQIRAQLRDKGTMAEEAVKAPPRAARGPVHERLLLQLMLLRSQAIQEVQGVLGPDGFSDPRHKKLAQELMTLWETEKKVNVQELLTRVGDEDLKALISELLLAEESVIDADRMLRDCLRKVRLSRVRQEIQHVDEEIRQRTREGQEGPAGVSGLKELLKRKQRLIVEQKNWVDDSGVGDRPAARQ
jgi:DNA primase